MISTSWPIDIVSLARHFMFRIPSLLFFRHRKAFDMDPQSTTNTISYYFYMHFDNWNTVLQCNLSTFISIVVVHWFFFFFRLSTFDICNLLSDPIGSMYWPTNENIMSNFISEHTTNKLLCVAIRVSASDFKLPNTVSMFWLYPNELVAYLVYKS